MKNAIKTKSAKPARKSAARRAPPSKAKKPAPKKALPNQPTATICGLAFREFEALRRQLDVSLDELTARLGLSRATVEQRKAAGRLTIDESGKVVSFARLLGYAVHHFGDLDEARLWLKTPQRGLHGAVPLDYAKTDFGAREVEHLLSQLGDRRRR
jgi:putative toxin-antitoxin system antitoxin component (TIGR02293 family)